MLSLLAHLIWRIRTKKPGLADALTLLAFVIGLLISGQTSWAMVVEGKKEHQNEFTARQVDVLAKVIQCIHPLILD